MAIAYWPSQVPSEPALNGVTLGQSYNPPDASETEGGPPLMTPRPGPRATEMPWRSKLLTAAQWQAFEQFARETLREGTLPFEMPVYRPGGFVTRMCQLKDGRFDTDLSGAPRFRITFTLIVYNL